jgi:hypothetical protein
MGWADALMILCLFELMPREKSASAHTESMSNPRLQNVFMVDGLFMFAMPPLAATN